MTATFGKLSHQTLTLEPGLNIITAPNEWGKSTWCAFLVAMLYGVDTRQQSKKDFLADKERYAPWSGELMSGRMEICWNGRDITLERSSKGRIPMGVFRAYETHSGLDVPELTAANCGQQLLGVEQSVFTRAGFIRLQQMPVTQDEALRRRLNNLVTTGDENGAADVLGKKLKELKNSCRYNRTGLLPQAEYEREQLRQQLQERQDLQEQSALLQKKLEALETEREALNIHLASLRYTAAREGRVKVRTAKALLQQAREQYRALQQENAALPEEGFARQRLEQCQRLIRQEQQLLDLAKQLPQEPEKPAAPEGMENMNPQQAVKAAAEDTAAYRRLNTQKKKQAKELMFLGAMSLMALIGAFLMGFVYRVPMPEFFIAAGIAIFVMGVVTVIVSVVREKKQYGEILAIFDRHPGQSPDKWIPQAEAWAQEMGRYERLWAVYEAQMETYQGQKVALEQEKAACGGEAPEQEMAKWQQVLSRHQALQEKGAEVARLQQQHDAMEAVAADVPAPEQTDSLTLTLEETRQATERADFAHRQTQLSLGQCIGKMDSIGQEEVLRARLDGLNKRIARLEDTYYALELAQDALYQASTALQRRFAPRISKRAQALFSQLTGGRYPKLSLGDDLSLSAGAENEDILRGTMWRSDGTVDQLYLALRLAVAGELTPEAPLVLDDALVRFDDDRLAAALRLLQQEGEQKQVILFTCQSRESQLKEEILCK